MNKREPTTDGIEILHRLFFEGKPEMIAALEEEHANLDISRKIYNLREEAGLSEKELADLVGTTPEVITQLEETDFDGHYLVMLKRIAAALGKQIKIQIEPVKTKDQELQTSTKS